MKSTSHSALGRLTRNSLFTLSSGLGAFEFLTVVIVVSAPYARPAHALHQPLHDALGDLDPLAAQLMPDLAGAKETKAGFMDTADLLLDLVVAPDTSRTLAGVGKARGVFVVGGRGGRQFPADRLDTPFQGMAVDERYHHLPWR